MEGMLSRLTRRVRYGRISTMSNAKRKLLAKSLSDVKKPRLQLLDTDEFARINAQMKEYDELREQVIKRSREIQKASKQAIFALHRGDDAQANKLFTTAESVMTDLQPMIQANPTLRDGAYSSSLEEYAEGKCFAHYLTHKSLLPMQEIPQLTPTEYLGGILDMSGEIVRYGVAKATARDVDEVTLCREMVLSIQEELLQFDFRNGALRKKFDSIKYNARKLENTLYELSLVMDVGNVRVRPTETEEHE